MAAKPLPRNRKSLEMMAEELRNHLALYEPAYRAGRDLEMLGMPLNEDRGEWLRADHYRLRLWNDFMVAYSSPVAPLTISGDYLEKMSPGEFEAMFRESMGETGSIVAGMLAICHRTRSLLTEVVAALDQSEATLDQSEATDDPIPIDEPAGPTASQVAELTHAANQFIEIGRIDDSPDGSMRRLLFGSAAALEDAAFTVLRECPSTWAGDPRREAFDQAVSQLHRVACSYAARWGSQGFDDSTEHGHSILRPTWTPPRRDPPPEADENELAKAGRALRLIEAMGIPDADRPRRGRPARNAERDALILTASDRGEKQASIARRHGMSVGAVKKVIKRAKEGDKK